MSYLDHIRRCNAFDPSRFRPFTVEGKRLGSVRDDFAARLAGFPDVFVVSDTAVALHPVLTSPDQRGAAVTKVMQSLRADGLLPPPRNELYPIVAQWGEPAAFLLDRAWVMVLGAKAFGLHVNGIVRDGGTTRLWIGKRALDREVEPGKLDNMIAGGQPAGLSLAENLLKEAAEEAGLAPTLAGQAKPVGALTYCMEGDLGLKPDTMFLYDLELSTEFRPQNTDGEISGFTLMDLDAVAERVRTSFDFKFNVALVLIDLLIREGRLDPDREPDYMALVQGVRTPI